jgi:hypothetical protein
VITALAILAIAVFLSGAALGALALLIVGIHSGSRGRWFTRDPRNRLEAVTRWVLGPRVRPSEDERDED